MRSSVATSVAVGSLTRTSPRISGGLHDQLVVYFVVSQIHDRTSLHDSIRTDEIEVRRLRQLASALRTKKSIRRAITRDLKAQVAGATCHDLVVFQRQDLENFVHRQPPEVHQDLPDRDLNVQPVQAPLFQNRVLHVRR